MIARIKTSMTIASVIKDQKDYPLCTGLEGTKVSFIHLAVSMKTQKGKFKEMSFKDFCQALYQVFYYIKYRL